MTFTLRDYQERDVQRFLDEPTRNGLNASSVGAGKTAVAVEAARRTEAQTILIVAPVNTFDGWQRHIRLIAGAAGRVMSNKDAGGQQAMLDLSDGKPGWYIIGWEFARKFDMSQLHVDFLIGDEIHRAQSRKSDNFLLFSRVAKAVEESGGRVMALSATPYGNKAEGAFGVAHSLWPKRFHHFWPFVDEFVGKEYNSYAGTFQAKRFEKIPGGIAAAMPLFWRHAPGYRCCEAHPQGINPDLPKRVIHPVTVPLTIKQRKLYDSLKSRMMAWVDEHEFPITTQGYPIVKSIRLRQVALAVPTPVQVTEINKKDGTVEDVIKIKFDLNCKSSKIDALLDIYADIPEGERVLVLTHSAGIIPAIVDRLNKKARRNIAVAWHGGTSAKDRQAYKDAFINNALPEQKSPVIADDPHYASAPVPAGLDDVQVIVAQVGAIGEGVDGLQWVCSNEVWFSMESNNLLNIQAAGRLERTGQERPVNSWMLMAENTIEQDQINSLNNQTKHMSMQLNQ